jgi:transcriptional regulator with XRE-family HTH domain
MDRIPSWRKQGLTEEQIAQKLGIAYSTLNLYKDSHLALSEALKKGKEELIEELEDSLYKKAMGYEYEEVETWIEEVDGVQKKRVKRVKKIAHPDTGALCFALKNLAADRWKDKQDTEQMGERIIVNIEPPPRPEVTDK